MACARTLGRKGSFFYSVLLVLAVIVILTYGTLRIYSGEKSKETKEIGEIQTNLINKFVKGEKAYFYLWQSGRYAQGDALSDFYLKGGLFDTRCGAINGYSLWVKGDKYCFPDYNSLKTEFGKKYSMYLNKYSEGFSDLDIKNDYKVIFDLENLIIDGNELIISDKNSKYYVNVDLELSVEDDLTYIARVVDQIVKNLEVCGADVVCWQKINDDFVIDKENNTVYFKVITNKKVGLLEKKQLILKFALDFDEYNPLFSV